MTNLSRIKVTFSADGEDRADYAGAHASTVEAITHAESFLNLRGWGIMAGRSIRTEVVEELH